MAGIPLFFADAAPAAVEQGFQQTLVMVAVAVIFFYFILWRPEQKRRKAMDEKRKGMKKGDRVVVAGGIVGEIFKVQEESIIVKLSEGAKMEVLKGAIQDLQPSSSSELSEGSEK